MSKTKFITRTAVILALAVMFQNLRYLIGAMPNSNLIIGSLVNLTIIVATGSVGLLSGIIVSLVTPIVAFYQGHLPHFFLAPVTMLGNCVFAVIFYLLIKSKLTQPVSTALGIVSGAIIKWIVLYWLGIKIVLDLFIPDMPAQKASVIAAAFNIPQIITALIGGILGAVIIKVINSKHTL
jgi:riboflavin transporter FmnP